MPRSFHAALLPGAAEIVQTVLAGMRSKHIAGWLKPGDSGSIFDL